MIGRIKDGTQAKPMTPTAPPSERPLIISAKIIDPPPMIIGIIVTITI